jgi:hypothetical protein
MCNNIINTFSIAIGAANRRISGGLFILLIVLSTPKSWMLKTPIFAAIQVLRFVKQQND